MLGKCILMCLACFRALPKKTVAEARSGVILSVFGFWYAALVAEGVCISEGGNQGIEF